MIKQTNGSNRYASVHAENGIQRNRRTYTQSFEEEEIDRKGNPIIYFKRGGKLLMDYDEPVPLIQSQQYETKEQHDSIQEWLFDNKKRSLTHLPSKFEKPPNIKDQRLRTSQNYNSNGSSEVNFIKRSRETYRSTHLNSEHKMRDQIIEQITQRALNQKKKSAEIYCNNCPQRRAKYHLLNNQQLFFCSKCSIKLLQKGFQVQQIQEWSNLKMNKSKAILLDFKEKLNSIHDATVQNMKQIVVNSTAQQQRSKQERQNIELTYNQIAIILERMKERQLKHLDEVDYSFKEEREEVHQKLKSQLQQIQAVQQEIQYLNGSLSPNKQIEIIIKNYTQKLVEFYSYQLIPKQSQPQESFDLRLQRLLNSVYEQILVGQQSSQTSFVSFTNPTLNYTDATIQQIKEPFRFLFPDDNDCESTRARQYN